jgi:hypothetical protein
MQNIMIRQRLSGIPGTDDVARLFGYSSGVTANEVLEAIRGEPDDGYIKANRSNVGQLELDVWRSDEGHIFFTMN